VEINETLMRYLISEVEFLKTGTVTVEICKSSNKTDVVTKALVNESIRKKQRTLNESQVQRIRDQVKLVEYGRVTIQVQESTGVPEIFSEKRQRFDKNKKNV
jgi:hypothetical protein